MVGSCHCRLRRRRICLTLLMTRVRVPRRAGPVCRRARQRHAQLGERLGFRGAPAFFRLAQALGVPAERLAGGVDDPAEGEAEGAEAKARRTRKRRTS